ILYALVITATIVGNLLVCAAVVVNANLRHVVSSYFIVSLAISDLATACFSMPFDMEYLITSGLWPRGEDFCIVWTTVYMIAIPTSILNLLVLSIDRYKTLKDPWDRFRESPFITKRRAVIAILVLWGYSLAFALVPITGVKHYPSSLYQGTCIFNMAPIYSVVGSFVNFVLPMLIMCCMYYKIFRIAHTKYRMPSRPKRDMHQVMQLPAMNEESKSPPDAEKVPPAVNNIRNSTKLRSRKKSAKKNNNSPEKAGLENAGFEEKPMNFGSMEDLTIRRKKYFVKNAKAARTISVIVGAFLLCWGPFVLFSIVMNICWMPCAMAVPYHVHHVFLLMGYINSMVNPLLFSYQNHQFRKAYWKI
ncbi:predicted protein, partial [Nematostella vectensis]